MKCIILDDYQNAAMSLADWHSLNGVNVINLTDKHEGEDLADRLKDAEIIVVMRERTPVTAQLIESLPKLKLIVTSGMRNSAIDTDAAVDRGITVCGTDSPKESPMELTWALILGLARNICSENFSFRKSGPWQSTLGMALHGKTLGLLGLGSIGKMMVPVARAFGMNVTAWSPNLNEERCREAGAGFCHSKEELFEVSDFLSIHLVLSDSTRGIVAESDLRLMKSSAYIINTSRSAIIDNKGLISVLQEGIIAGAGLDVFDEEPLPGNHMLRRLDNVLATPHLGYVTDMNYRIYFEQALEDIKAYLEGEPVRVLK